MQFTVPLCENRDFRRMYAKADNVLGGCMVVYGRRNRSGVNRLGFTVSTKVGNAVIRNRARRRLKECYRLHEKDFKTGFDIVIAARGRAVTAPFEKLQREMLDLCRKLGLMRSL